MLVDWMNSYNLIMLYEYPKMVFQNMEQGVFMHIFRHSLSVETDRCSEPSWFGGEIVFWILNTVCHYIGFKLKEKWYLKTGWIYNLMFHVPFLSSCWLCLLHNQARSTVLEVMWNSIICDQNEHSCFLQKVLNRISLQDIFSLLYNFNFK